jgi:hypothetical protein
LGTWLARLVRKYQILIIKIKISIILIKLSVSFIGFIMLTKLLSRNVAVLTGILYYSRSLQIFRVYFSNMEMTLL